MGCTSSLYDNPEITAKQASSQHMMKSTNGSLVIMKPGILSPTSRNQIHPHSIKTSSRQTDRNDTDRVKSPENRVVSPVPSDVSEARSTKRVNFIVTDEEALKRPITGSHTHRPRAKKKREHRLREKLLAKMTEAEGMTERLFLESERLSLTSSMSRTTSRTASPSLLDGAPLTDPISKHQSEKCITETVQPQAVPVT